MYRGVCQIWEISRSVLPFESRFDFVLNQSTFDVQSLRSGYANTTKVPQGVRSPQNLKWTKSDPLQGMSLHPLTTCRVQPREKFHLVPAENLTSRLKNPETFQLQASYETRTSNLRSFPETRQQAQCSRTSEAGLALQIHDESNPHLAQANRFAMHLVRPPRRRGINEKRDADQCPPTRGKPHRHC